MGTKVAMIGPVSGDDVYRIRRRRVTYGCKRLLSGDDECRTSNVGFRLHNNGYFAGVYEL